MTVSPRDLGDVELQNQDGVCRTFADIFGGRTALIAFFYTRCMNPAKCSRTVSQLARVDKLVRRRLPESNAIVAGITYDPAYDLPERLHRYGTDRGVVFGRHCQLFRSTGSFERIRATLDLGVGYGSTTVNRHRVELVLLDPTGEIAEITLRRLWDEHDMVERLAAIESRARAGDEPLATCCTAPTTS